jgi:hypothetical protein
MPVSCEYCVLSDRGLCDGLVTRPEESYRVWCVLSVIVKPRTLRRPRPPKGLSNHWKKNIWMYMCDLNDATNNMFMSSLYFQVGIISFYKHGRPFFTILTHIYLHRPFCLSLAGTLSSFFLFFFFFLHRYTELDIRLWLENISSIYPMLVDRR